MEKQEKFLLYAKENKDRFIEQIIYGKTIELNKEAVFMAGSPGAGKTEVAQGLAENYDNHVIIDADEFRRQFPEYNGQNSSLFQKGSSWLVEQSFRYVLEKGYSFILDGTFALISADDNIKRALKSNFSVSIFYVYQDPVIAWEFTKRREEVEGRYVPKETFLNAFFKSRKNIEKVKKKYPNILLNIIMKDYQNNISEVHFSTDNVELLLPMNYTYEQLEGLLND